MQKNDQKEEISKIVSFYLEKIRKLCEKKWNETVAGKHSVSNKL